MKKTFAIAALALGLFAFGCDDDEDAPKTTTDAATNKPDAADAATSTPDAGPDTSTTVDTGGTADAADAGPTADASDDASADGGLPVAWVDCKDPKEGVSAADFCVQYLKACTFDPTGGTMGMERYKTVSECTMAYDALTSGKKACAAYHLCVASQAGMAPAHCPHPPEASLVPAAGPCAAR